MRVLLRTLCLARLSRALRPGSLGGGRCARRVCSSELSWEREEVSTASVEELTGDDDEARWAALEESVEFFEVEEEEEEELDDAEWEVFMLERAWAEDAALTGAKLLGEEDGGGAALAVTRSGVALLRGVLSQELAAELRACALDCAKHAGDDESLSLSLSLSLSKRGVLLSRSLALSLRRISRSRLRR